MINRIATFLPRQERQNVAHCADREGALAWSRGEGLRDLIDRGWREFPGAPGIRAGLVLVAVLGYLDAAGQDRGKP